MLSALPHIVSGEGVEGNFPVELKRSRHPEEFVQLKKQRREKVITLFAML